MIDKCFISVSKDQSALRNHFNNKNLHDGSILKLEYINGCYNIFRNRKNGYKTEYEMYYALT